VPNGVKILRGTLTFRLDERGVVHPTIVVAYAVGDAGPFLVEVGPPPLNPKRVADLVRKEAAKVDAFLEEQSGATR